jgi:hypothetical protein
VGDMAAINATDSRAMILAFIRFPIGPILSGNINHHF